MKITALVLVFNLISGLAVAQWSEVSLSIKGDPGTLKAAWVKTSNNNKVVLIIPGSGPTDMNGNSSIGLTNNSLKMIAESLGDAGIASLRIDKRGIASSKSAMIAEDSLTLDNFIADVTRWTQLLTDSLSYQSVIILGHSQGSLVGMIATGNKTSISGFISLAGAGEPIGETLKKQISKQAPVLSDETEIIVDSLSMGYQVKKVNPFLVSIFRPSIQPFLISYMRYDPLEEIAKIKRPVLIINGTTDIQVDTENAVRLDSASATSKILLIEGMNHILKDAPEELSANMATYNQPDLPLSKGLMPAIINFINDLN